MDMEDEREEYGNNILTENTNLSKKPFYRVSNSIQAHIVTLHTLFADTRKLFTD